MRYWIQTEKGPAGPYDASDLQKLPMIGPGTLVAPEGSTSPDAWKPLSSFPDIRTPAAAPPPPPPSRPSAVEPSSGHQPELIFGGAGVVIVICIGLAMRSGVSTNAQPKIAEAPPSTPDLTAKGERNTRGLPPNWERRRVQIVEERRKAEEAKLEKERRAGLFGEPIDYIEFYAKSKSTGLHPGKRYRFSATVSHDLCLAEPGAQYLTDDKHTMCTHCTNDSQQFDEPVQYEAFLKGPDRQTMTVVATLLESSLGGYNVCILRLE